MADSSTGKSPAFQFYPKDFTSDEEQAAMTLAEAGMFIRLLCACWTNGSIPADTSKLHPLCNSTPREVLKHWPAVSVKFTPHPTEPGRLVNPRMERERVKQNEYRDRQASAANKRWHPRGNATALPVESRTGNALQSSSPSSSSSSSSSAEPERKERAPSARTHAPGLMARPSQHGDCLAHGPVCFRPRIADKYLPRFGGDHGAMVLWATRVCAQWTDRTERGERVPEGDDFAFWAKRYDESFGASGQSGLSVKGNQTANAAAKWLSGGAA